MIDRIWTGAGFMLMFWMGDNGRTGGLKFWWTIGGVIGLGGIKGIWGRVGWTILFGLGGMKFILFSNKRLVLDSWTENCCFGR